MMESSPVQIRAHARAKTFLCSILGVLGRGAWAIFSKLKPRPSRRGEKSGLNLPGIRTAGMVNIQDAAGVKECGAVRECNTRTRFSK
jgi:hypothetical protein